MKTKKIPNDKCAFWTSLEALVASCKLVLDRPAGTPHPHYAELIYPLDYGYLEATRAIDGEGLDCWLGSLPRDASNGPELNGVLITLDPRKKDVELKLLLACNEEEIQTAMAFHCEICAMPCLLIRREPLREN